MALNLDAALEQLFRGEILSEETVKEVCERLKESMIYQPNVQPIKAPVTVVGNLHGYVVFGAGKSMFLRGALSNALLLPFSAPIALYSALAVQFSFQELCFNFCANTC